MPAINPENLAELDRIADDFLEAFIRGYRKEEQVADDLDARRCFPSHSITDWAAGNPGSRRDNLIMVREVTYRDGRVLHRRGKEFFSYEVLKKVEQYFPQLAQKYRLVSD